MKLLREKYPEAPSDTVWKDYYSKGHEISYSGAYCVNCDQYVTDMSECLATPECKGNPMTPTIITQGSIITYPPTPPIFVISADNGEPLFTIKPDGAVEAEKLENASLAGKMFVESIRCHLSSGKTDKTDDSSNDEFLNKTEDLHLLSKIIDAMKDENITEAVALIHAVRKSDREFISRLQREIINLKEEHQEQLLNVSTN